MLRSKKSFIILTIITIVIFVAAFISTKDTVGDIPPVLLSLMIACAPGGLLTAGPAIINFGANIGGIFDESVGRFAGGFFGIIIGAGLGMIIVPISFLIGLGKLIKGSFDEPETDN